MSGIAGLFYLDGRPVEQAEVEQMTNILAHRGPDDAGIWRNGSVGLGHRMLWTTPESLHEKLPLTNTTGELAITADARIDNRDELLPLLGFNDRPAADVADSQLILAAYEKWGEQCPEKLIGDFAFVIWDGRRQQMFCARDHLGVKPFLYYSSRQLFVFSSEIKTLFCLPEVPRRLNEVRVAYHLQPELMHGNKTITFYQDILRLPPAHSLTVGSDGTRLRPYWMLDPSRELSMESGEAYAEAFLEIFTEAVRCRLRSAYPVGSKLSGGLDSSSIVCVAQRLLAQNGNNQLHTFSAVYDEVPESDERRFIEPVLAQGGLVPHYVHPDQLSPLTDQERVLWHGDEPFTSPTIYIPREICRAAHQQGVRVLLGGLSGDNSVGHGNGYLAELARAGQWETFAREAKAISQHQNLSPVSFSLRRYGLSYLTELARGWRWGAFARESHELLKHFNVSRRYLLRNYWLKPVIFEPLQRIWQALPGRNQPARYVYPIINRSFAKRMSLDKQARAVAGNRSILQRTAREEHYMGLSTGLIPYGYELADRNATAFSMEERDPFSDKRLVELCLALPPEQKLHQGWNRIVFRRAMAGILPEEIRWRGGKGSNSAAFTHGLLKFEAELLEEVIMKDAEGIEAYVDIAALRETYHRYLSEKNRDDEMRVWTVVTLAQWLRHTDLTP